MLYRTLSLLLLLFSGWTSADELKALIDELKPPARFADYEPEFSWEERTIMHPGPRGSSTQKIQVIMDHGRPVAIRSQRPRLDLITHDPALTPETLKMPVRYHNQTYFNATLTTVAWFGAWRVTAQSHTIAFDTAPGEITLTEKQIWDGTKGWAGTSTHTFTIRVDPVLGYVVDANMTYEGERPVEKGKKVTGVELSNLLVRDMPTPWPREWRLDYTVFSRRDLPQGSYAGWANNNIAADLSDNGKLPLRNGGLVAFLDKEEAWGPVLTRKGNLEYSLQTCNVWQDQHNHAKLPKEPDADGVYRLKTDMRLAFLPPEINTYLYENTEWNTFEGKRRTLIRLGQVEDFEDQPLPLTTTVRGVATHKLPISTERAFSGTSSLKMKSHKPESRGHFLFLPQIPVRPHTAYRIEAQVWVEEGTRASITANLYEWTPHNHERFERIETNMVSESGSWQKIEADIPAQEWDPYTDLRFRVVGGGHAFFDDLHVRAIE